jgi:hypothetical protein
MRFFLLILVVVSVSALSEPIKDFAPDQVGNMWKYKIYHSWEDPTSFNSFGCSYLTRTFKLLTSEIISNYTQIIFDIIDSGIDSITFGTVKPIVSVSAIQKNYSDTSFQFGDSIQGTWPDWTDGRFSPFFKYHTVDSYASGMAKILFKNDSVFQYIFAQGNGLSTYIQNVGLDSLTALWGGDNTSYYLSAKLISFTPAPTSITQPPKKFNPVQTARQNVPGVYIFDLQGRRFQKRSLSALPPGLMINRGVNYLQVK